MKTVIQPSDTVLASRVSELRGIQENMRITATDVQASPPQIHTGRVIRLWSDGKAAIAWDYDHFERDRHLVQCGHVDLHHIRRLNA